MTFNKRKIFKYIATFTIILLMLVNSGCKPLTLEVIDVIDSEPIDSQIEITTTSPATQTTTTPQITQTTPPIIATTPEPSTLVVTPLNQVMYVTGAGNIRTAPEIVDETRTGKTLIEGIEINVTGSAIGSDGEVWYSFIQDDITLWAHNQFFSSVNDEPSTSTPSSPEERARELASLTANDERIDNEWALWLINAWNPLPERYVPPSLQPIGGGFELDSRAAEYAKLMIEAARNDGITLTVVSSYRSEERQTNNFRNYFNNAVSAGRSREEAFA
ncbi:MAG: D-alanyl-D-alanine carboxypeptidase family protein, partial [Oscillospiraceae bacterium]|nr:D-alanyl-D-alanine carboxypeptidase family protein [Oscillospiraceae bacterium]